ncbi:MAG: class I SAM-dependent methyltransferase [Patescibacteria group bacterium]|nr:class I SAM-dependent methyltransferase [Patescibacteria group bacterium]
MSTLNSTDFARMFSCPADDLSDSVLDMIWSKDWTHQVLEGLELSAVVNDLNSRLAQLNKADSGTERWDLGWKENLDNYKSTGDLKALDPRYIRPNQPLRLHSQFIKAKERDFELNWYKVFRQWFFSNFLSGYRTIYEFGSGSGHNLPFLCEMFPMAEVHALDWSIPAIEIAEELRRRLRINVTGRRFDLFNPDGELAPNSAVLTVGVIEQTGTKWPSFLEWLIDQKPGIVCHIEPIVEWYYPDNVVDRTAIDAHCVRGFQTGYVEALRERQREGRIRILRTHRTGFGSMVTEGYSQLIWEVVR